MDTESPLADPAMRLAAVLIDAAANLAPLLVLLPLNAVLHSAAIVRWTLWASAVVMPLVFVLNLFLLHRFGQTIGKRLLGLRIVKRDGSRAALGTLFWRRIIIPGAISLIPLVGGLFPLVDALFIFSKRRETVHDHIAGTMVIDLARTPAEPPTAF